MTLPAAAGPDPVQDPLQHNAHRFRALQKAPFEIATHRLPRVAEVSQRPSGLSRKASSL